MKDGWTEGRKEGRNGLMFSQATPIRAEVAACLSDCVASCHKKYTWFTSFIMCLKQNRDHTANLPCI